MSSRPFGNHFFVLARKNVEALYVRDRRVSSDTEAYINEIRGIGIENPLTPLRRAELSAMYGFYDPEIGNLSDVIGDNVVDAVVVDTSDIDQCF